MIMMTKILVADNDDDGDGNDVDDVVDEDDDDDVVADDGDCNLMSELHASATPTTATEHIYVTHRTLYLYVAVCHM